MNDEELVEAVCWECGETKPCREIVVCCTGTLVHICLDCDPEVGDEVGR